MARCAKLVKCKPILHSFIFTKASESGARGRVVIGRKNPFPKAQGRLASERSSREE